MVQLIYVPFVIVYFVYDRYSRNILHYTNVIQISKDAESPQEMLDKEIDCILWLKMPNALHIVNTKINVLEWNKME